TGETGWFSSPAVVDLAGNGTKQVVAPCYSTFVFDAQGNRLAKGTATGGRGYAPEVVADLAGDGTTEIVVGGSDPTGPAGTSDDPTFNGVGNQGYGCYGENVGIGNIDDDAQLEILVTYDDHQINAFDPDGSSLLASSWYLDRQTQYQGMRLGWGQFIRWRDPT